ncbi:MAG: 1-acyl-sn-glycerol-3-phosphate acyltransferase [Deltaproteobacteria bacterium]|jgi:glycerol-3-phosphate O-acyltransferase|nr:1-acyl-sn-glycerol-3-phosphate acyltransferase [Deltaproteobacteria bacterium]MDL1987295.1 1-acyl-sn-glycerol-3-phosphate acyltransferase [Deltaproteobacteria bacterium]
MTRLIKQKLRGWIDNFLKRTYNHFLCYLPVNIGFFSSWILKLFFSGVKLDKEQTSVIRKIPKESIIIYATKHKSYFKYLFYHTRYRQEGLPVPEIGLDYRVVIWQPVSRIFRIILAYLDYIFYNKAWPPNAYKSGYIKHELIKRRSGLLSLVEKRGFYRRFVKEKADPIRYLIEIQKSIKRPIFIVPQLMFFSTNPHRSTPNIIDILFGTQERPGKIRRIVTLFKNPGNIFVEISEPVNLKEFLELTENRYQSIEHQSLQLRRYLLVQINQHRRSIVGPILKSREELKENVLTNNRLQKFMYNHSKKRDIPIQKVHKEADVYLDEIAAKYNIAVIRMAAVVVKWVVNTMFEGVTVNNDVLNRVKNMSKKGPLILVPCHKSHIDYLILSYTLLNNNMPCPHIAAGKNLSFWPLGPLFRRGGAFFIRRTFRGAVLYSKVFAEYINKLLEEGFNIEMFIEGGRSRTGKLIMPKLGLLSMLLNAYKNESCEDMIFVPIFIGYDRVLEETAYLNEIEGGQKEPESLLQVIKAGRLLKKRYGRIYIKFHEPMSLKELLSEYGSKIQDMSSKEQNVFIRNLGHRIINAIDNVSLVTPYALVASAILNCPKKSFTYNYLISEMEIYMTYLFSKNAKMADTLVLDQARAFERALEHYTHRKFIEKIPKKDKKSQSSDVIFKVNESKRPVLEYYKNNCISFFIPAAFTALAILEKDAFQFSTSDIVSGYTFLQEFFKNEFSYDVDKTQDYFVRKNIKIFIDDAILMPHSTLPDTYNITSAGYRKLKLFSSFLKPYFESYFVVLNFFMRYPKEFINTKDRLKKVQSIGNRMYKRKEIERKEALSKINFQNAVDYFVSHGVKSSDDHDKIKLYDDTIKKYMSYLPQ